MVLGAVVMFITAKKKIIPDDVFEKKYIVIKRSEYDSLTRKIEVIERLRAERDSLLVARLKPNTAGIKIITHEIESIHYEDYTDAMLDSVVWALYPRAN